MKIYSIKPKFQKFLSPVKNIFIKLKVHPTTINFMALFFSILAGLSIYYSSFDIRWLIAFPFLVYFRIALNALDGLVARELKVKNQDYGEVLNEFIDRLSDVAIFVGLIFTSYVNSILASGAIIAVLLVSYIGIVGKAAGGSRQYVGLMGKADRMFYLGLACVIILIWGNLEVMNYALWFILALAIITILQRFSAIKKELYK